MSTINISLPSEQVVLIDSLVLQYGFANRSELVRSVFRLLRHEPAMLTQASTFPLLPPASKNGKEVLESFRESGKYSKAFMKDLEEGINDSGYFSNTK